MTRYEKIEEYKDIIIKLYEKEGRSITYIANLIGVQRNVLSKWLGENQLRQGQKFYLKPSTQKWINKNKDKIIKLIYQGLSDYAISKELGCSYEMIHNSCMRGSKEIKEARERYYIGLDKKIKESGTHPDEEWRPVLGYDNICISNYGRLVSYRSGFPVEIAPILDQNRRYSFILGFNGKSKTFKRARLVAHAFCPNSNPDVNNTVDHINGDCQDDRAVNLEWVSQSENNKRAYKNGRVKNRAHNVHNRNEIFIVDNKYEFKTIAALARFIGKSETQTRRIVAGEVKNPEYNIQIIYKV